MEITAIARKWGSSLAIIIPKEIVDIKKINDGEEIKVRIEKKRPKAGVMWGALKEWKKPTQQIKDEMRRGWESDSDRKRRD